MQDSVFLWGGTTEDPGGTETSVYNRAFQIFISTYVPEKTPTQLEFPL